MMKPSLFAKIAWNRLFTRRKATYKSPGMIIYGNDFPVFRDPKFCEAYQIGQHSGRFRHNPFGSPDLRIEWRAYIECWGASQGLALPGDFVFCGVNTGMMPLAVCYYLDINKTGKCVWLFDTYKGIPVEQISEHENKLDRASLNDAYPECFELAKKNFAPFPRAHLVRGKVPDTLPTVSIDAVSYLSIDMNIAYPERAAIEHFWPKLSPGAVVVLDDYGGTSHGAQRASMDEFAATKNLKVLNLPTGQGMLLKPL
jgi:O-methyltransferase